MKLISVHDKQRLEDYLLRTPQLNYYHLGDLDEFFWPHTVWYGLEDDGGELQAVALLYTAPNPPVLLAIVNDNQALLEDLLRGLLPLLPPRVYAHLSPGLEKVLGERYAMASHGLHYKMGLREPERLDVDMHGALPLTVDDLPAIERLYAAAYPGNWFDPRMLETGQYVGIWAGAELLAVAGVHVYSPVYRVAALGNITVLPARRGQGLGKAVTAAASQRLLKMVDTLGLNVLQENAAAIAVYRTLGFEVMGEYEEWMLMLKTPEREK